MNLESYPLYAAAYKLNLDGLPRLAKFPKEYRRLLAEPIAAEQRAFLSLCTEAIFAKAPERPPLLRRCNLLLEGLRCLWRLARDLGVISYRGYGAVLTQLDGAGRMVGGWLAKLSGSHQPQEAFF